MKILDVPQSGSVAGVTSSRNRFGQYRRTRAMPTNPATPAQTAARAQFSALSAAWRSITAEQQQGWINLADTRPYNDSLGQTYYLTGHQTFVQVNSLRGLCGLDLVETAPDFTAPAGQTSVTAAATLTGGTTFEAEIVGTDLDTGDLFVVSASAPLSAGVRYVSDYRFMAAEAASGDTASVDISALYPARFGGNPPVGTRIGWKAERLSPAGVPIDSQTGILTVTAGT